MNAKQELHRKAAIHKQMDMGYTQESLPQHKAVEAFEEY